MQVRISKALEGILARTIFESARNGVDHSLKDCLMLNILHEQGSVAVGMLASLAGEDALAQAAADIGREIAAHPSEGLDPQEFFVSYAASLRERFRSAGTVSTAHVTADILGDATTASSQIFARCGVGADAIAAELESLAIQGMRLHPAGLRSDDGDIPFMPSSANIGAERFGIDLTRLAREGRLDPVAGRDAEIGRVVQILSRRKKNNPILVGEAGVGKSAIVEGLALRIATGDVPHTIAGKRIISLDVSSLVAGTKFRGEFEERMHQLLSELERADDTIVFIDEIHTIVGAGATSGSLDTANILKPALARGSLQTIGATTLDEYRENIECDSALERRFQRVMVEPPSPGQTLHILRNIAPAYEQHHCVRYTDEAIRACVELSGRYISDRHFPDKAIDVMDEAGSQAHLHHRDKPQRLRELEHMAALACRERREAVEALAYDRAAAARLREIALRSQLDEGLAEWQRSMTMNPVEVTAGDVACVITSATGIPAERLAAGEAERLQQLESQLSARVIGQEDAVKRVVRSIRRSRAGLKDENRPVGVFLFVGPAGVGKTLLAKELAGTVFDGRQGLIRIDMTEYGERHSLSRLVGSPPGYVGYGEGGQLTEAVRRHPYSVVLLDEIEKAHPEVCNAMLPIFDEGRLTDGTGRTVDFCNTVIIMTSNAGTHTADSRSSRVGYTTSVQPQSELPMPADEWRRGAERMFAPEFLNRVDEIIRFRSLAPEDVRRIVDIELDALAGRVERLGYNIRITPGARRRLAEMGYGPHSGARPLKRVVAERISEPVSNMIIDGRLCSGDTIMIEKSRGGFSIKVA